MSTATPSEITPVAQCACPKCGYYLCPHCGRSNPYPILPYPYVPWINPWPYPYPYSVTWGSNTAGQSDSGNYSLKMAT